MVYEGGTLRTRGRVKEGEIEGFNLKNKLKENPGLGMMTNCVL